MTDVIRPVPDQNEAPTQEPNELRPHPDNLVKDPVQDTGSSSLVEGHDVEGYSMALDTVEQPTTEVETATDATVPQLHEDQQTDSQPSFLQRHWKKFVGTGVGIGLMGSGAAIGSQVGDKEADKLPTPPAAVAGPGHAAPNQAPVSVAPNQAGNNTPEVSSDPYKTPNGQTVQYAESSKGQDLGSYIYPPSLRNEPQFTPKERDVLDFYQRSFVPGRAQTIEEKKPLIFRPGVCIVDEQNFAPKAGGSPETITRFYVNPEHIQTATYDYYTFTNGSGSGMTIAVEKGQTGLTKTAVFPATKSAHEVKIINDEVPSEVKATILGSLQEKSGAYEGKLGAPLFMGNLQEQNPEIRWEKTGELIGKDIARPFVAGGIAVVLGKVPDDQLAATCENFTHQSGFRSE